MIAFKDTRMYSLDVYTSDGLMSGIEINYLMDGDVLKHVFHRQVRKALT